jgi:hypothetical protein
MIHPEVLQLGPVDKYGRIKKQYFHIMSSNKVEMESTSCDKEIEPITGLRLF